MSKVLRNTIPFKQVRTNQPQTPVGIDWTNPITKGLTGCIVPSISIDTELVYAVKDSSSVNYRPKRVIGRDFVGITLGVSSPISTDYVIPDSGYKANQSCFVICKPTANTYTGKIWGVGSSHIYSTGIGVVNDKFQATGQTNYSITNSLSDFSFVLNQTYAIASVEKGINVNLYADGRLSTVATLGNKVGSGHKYFGSNYYSNPRAVEVYLALGWNRALTAEEVKSISANPWQIFQPITHTIPYDMVRGAMSKRESYLLECSRPPPGSQNMPVAMVKEVCMSQPQYNAQIDWSNPITRALRVTLLPSCGLRNLAGTRFFVDYYGANASWKRSAGRAGIVLENAASTNYRIENGESFVSPGWTSLALLTPRINATYLNQPLVMVDSAGWRAACVAMTDGANPRFANYYNGSSKVSDTKNYTLGKEYAVVATSGASAQRLYVDGVLKNTVAASLGNPGYSRRATLYSPSPTAGATQVALVLVWTRELSASEISALYANPWQIFKSPSKPVWVPA